MSYSRVKDLTGMKFGKLTVLALAKMEPKVGSSWLCRCECGKEKVIQRGRLTTGHVKSCGCAMIANKRTQAFRAFGYFGRARKSVAGTLPTVTPSGASDV